MRHRVFLDAFRCQEAKEARTSAAGCHGSARTGHKGRGWYTLNDGLVPSGRSSETNLPAKALGFRVQEYGMTKWRDLFTQRQLVALTTFSDLIGEAIEGIRCDAAAASMSDDNTPLRDGGTGSQAYAEAVAVYRPATDRSPSGRKCGTRRIARQVYDLALLTQNPPGLRGSSCHDSIVNIIDITNEHNTLARCTLRKCRCKYVHPPDPLFSPAMQRQFGGPKIQLAAFVGLRVREIGASKRNRAVVSERLSPNTMILSGLGACA